MWKPFDPRAASVPFSSSSTHSSLQPQSHSPSNIVTELIKERTSTLAHLLRFTRTLAVRMQLEAEFSESMKLLNLFVQGLEFILLLGVHHLRTILSRYLNSKLFL